MKKARAKMWESAIRGLWPKSIEEAKKVLAQSGGDDDEARMLIATGHIATRRLDAARGALRGLQQPEGYDEPELLAFICEWLDRGMEVLMKMICGIGKTTRPSTTSMKKCGC